VALTVLDAGVLIAVLNGRDVHHIAARRALSSEVGAGQELVLPASVYAEILVEPHQRGATAVRQVDAFVAALPARVEAIDTMTAQTAARIRARHRTLRLPDAFVIATAHVLDADHVLTTDRRWPRALGVAVRVVVVG